MGIMGSASVKRRRTREGSNRSTTSSYTSMPGLISTASRQYSNGSSASVGPRVTKSASAVAQEALTAGGALQTVEGREEGAVASRVSRGGVRGWIWGQDGGGSGRGGGGQGRSRLARSNVVNASRARRRVSGKGRGYLACFVWGMRKA